MKSILTIALSITTVTALATPTHYITHNDTQWETNVVVKGVESPFPTLPYSTRKVAWRMVRLGCGITPVCAAVIMVATDTAEPIEVGTLYMDMESGELTPKRISAHGYTAQVKDIAEVMITQDLP
ncbi:hypothetical protein J2N86_14175 (plasmid) [Legionella lytica]|jgi:hypothetical protein|uniref:Uncharacterized protein n=1 Tax=Legionella lytica TaxID=96232 RepID=A0ABY4YCM3_9GAMM|nr:hypothetical protein [Legionella lytica]USQ15393.1 hypothetical protein J2N86_14175 [Legionella lytica]